MSSVSMVELIKLVHLHPDKNCFRIDLVSCIRTKGGINALRQEEFLEYIKLPLNIRYRITEEVKTPIKSKARVVE